MISGRWLLDPTTGTFLPLPAQARQRTQGADAFVLQQALSPSGERMAVSDGRTVSHGLVGGPLGAALEIPPVVFRPPAAEPPPLRTAVFWLSEQLLAIYQVDVEAPEEPVCALLEVDTHRWRSMPRCPSAGFLEMKAARPGPHGWVSLLSVGEDSATVRLVHYLPARQSFSEPAVAVHLAPSRGLSTQFALDTPRLYLATPCMMERQAPPPCEGIKTESPWRLYAWTGPGNPLLLINPALPSGSVPHPSGTRWAWVDGDRICVAGVSSAQACFTPPGG